MQTRNADRWEMNNTNLALFVIDMQNCWLHPKGIAYNSRLRVVPAVRSAISFARKAGIQIIYLYTAYKKDLSDAGVYPDLGLYKGRMFDAKENWSLFEGTEGTKIIDEVAPTNKDIVIKKMRYSGFIGTELETILRESGLNTIVISGISSNVCCESTARDGMMLNFRVVFLSDCTATRSLAANILPL